MKRGIPFSDGFLRRGASWLTVLMLLLSAGVAPAGAQTFAPTCVPAQPCAGADRTIKFETFYNFLSGRYGFTATIKNTNGSETTLRDAWGFPVYFTFEASGLPTRPQLWDTYGPQLGMKITKVGYKDGSEIVWAEFAPIGGATIPSATVKAATNTWDVQVATGRAESQWVKEGKKMKLHGISNIVFCWKQRVDPCTLPSAIQWVGNSITSQGDGTGYFELTSLLSISRISLGTPTVNTVLLQPRDMSNQPIAGFVGVGAPTPAVTGEMGYTSWEYRGDPATAPIKAMRQRIGAIRQANVNFFVEIDDECPGSLQRVDPEGDLFDGEMPTKPALLANYPNPFNPSTTIRFELPEQARVSLSVFDVTGRQVRTLVNETMDAGTHAVEWDGTSDAGFAVASGVYLYRIDTGNYTQTRHMMLLK